MFYNKTFNQKKKKKKKKNRWIILKLVLHNYQIHYLLDIHHEVSYDPESSIYHHIEYSKYNVVLALMIVINF